MSLAKKYNNDFNNECCTPNGAFIRYNLNEFEGKLTSLAYSHAVFVANDNYWMVNYNHSIIPSEIEIQFNEYSRKWKMETAGYSTTVHITRNDNYLDIIGMGNEIVPFILKDLQKETNHWFVALKAITKENPVSKEHFGNIEQMRQDWLAWGEQKNLI